MHEPKQLMAAAGLPNDQTNLKAMGVKTEMNTHANETHGIGPIGNGPQNAAALNNYQNPIGNGPQNAAALNNYQNILRSSVANQSLLQQEASSMFKGPTAMHNGIQLEASRSFRGPNQVHLAQFQHPASFQQPMPQQSSLQGLGVSPQYQQHVLHQLLQEAKNTNNRVLAQQQQQQQLQHAPANSGLASGGTAITGSAASGDHMNNNGAVKGGTPMVTTGPSSVINNTASILPSRSNSFKSVSSNPQVAAAAGGGIGSGGHAATPKADALHELDDLDYLGNLISTELEESGLFLGDQAGGGYSWNM